MKNKRYLFGTICVVLMLVLLCGCTQNTEEQRQSIQKYPHFDVISYNQRTGYEGLDYVVYIDITIYNKGGAGHGTIWCRLSQDNSFWTKSQTTYVNENGRSELTLVFREVSFWGGGGEIQIWVTY
jgi:hypothetical protein